MKYPRLPLLISSTLLSCQLAVAAQGDTVRIGLKQILADPNGTVDTRRARLTALFVPDDEPVSPFLESGQFISIWEGDLNLKLNDYFIFSVQGQGAVEVELRGKKILESDGPDLSGTRSGEIDLKKGPNPIRITYASPPKGDAEFRLYWWNPLQPEEPIPPDAFTFDAGQSDFRKAEQRRLGRQLFADAHCLKCHQVEEPLGERAMPELSKDAPSLTGIGTRLKERWMVEWLVDPKGKRAAARMPRVLHGDDEEIARAARDIAAFLAAETPDPGSTSIDDSDRLNRTATIDAGEEHYHTLGCMTCHTLPGDAPLEEESRLSLAGVRAKWKPAALVEFLKDPTRYYQWIRMPHFRLSDEEATGLAAFVLSKGDAGSGSNSDAPRIGDATRGRELVSQVGCVRCHSMEGVESVMKAPTLSAIQNGAQSGNCLDDDDVSAVRPSYSFSAAERVALADFIANDLHSLNRRVWPEFGARQFENLRCYACHTRDDRSDLWSTLIVAEGSEFAADSTAGEDDLIDDFGDDFANDFGDDFGDDLAIQEDNIHHGRPPLTWAGEKLIASWMERFIAGHLTYKPRSHIQARMPGFPRYAEGLALGLVMEHGFSAQPPEEIQIDAELARIGGQLIQMDKFGCVSCHALGNQPALSGAASEAINFQYSHERLRAGFYRRFVLDPQRLLPGTMMPKFIDDEGRSPLTDLFDGDAHQQFDAIWHYVKSLKRGVSVAE